MTTVQEGTTKRFQFFANEPFDPKLVPDDAWETIISEVPAVRRGDIPRKDGNVYINKPTLSGDVHGAVFRAIAKAGGGEVMVV